MATPTRNPYGLMATREHTEPAVCPVYGALCDQEDGHEDHSLHLNGMVGYGFTHLSGSQQCLYVEGCEFTPDEAPQKMAELRALADRIEAMATSASDTRQVTRPARTWTYTRRPDRAQVTVTCPPWCANGHEGSQEFGEHFSDISHHAYGRTVTIQATETSTYEDRELLSAQLGVGPDDEDTARRTPYVQVELVDEVWSRPMGPDELAEFIGTVAGQLAELRRMHAQLLRVRDEYRGRS